MTDDDIKAAMREAMNNSATVGRDYTAGVIADGLTLIESQAAEIARLKAGGCARDQGLTQFCAEAAKFAAENARLRQIISECATAIGNGSFCDPDASVDFMVSIPVEIRAVVAELRAGGWRPISEAPRDGTPIACAEVYRYMPYKPDGRRQMKQPGRWQRRVGEYGHWHNEEPPAAWMPADALPPSPTDTTTAEG